MSIHPEDPDSPEAYISNSMISFTTGVKQIVIAAPIQDKGKIVRGMLGLSIPWEYIHDRVQTLVKESFSGVQGSAKVMLVANDGTYWYHWDENKIIQLLRDDQGDFVLNEQGEKAVSKYSILNEHNPKLNALGNEMITGNAGMRALDLGGEAHQPIPGSRYSIGVALEDHLMLAPVRKTLENTFVILFSAFILIIAAGFFLVKYFSQPVAQLLDKISRLAAGESVDRSIVTNTEELQVLSKAIFSLYDTVDTQRKKIRDSKELFSLIVQGSNDGIWDWDILANSLYLSPRWKAIIGYQDDELENDTKAFQKHVHPEDRHQINTLFSDLIKGKADTSQCRFRMLKKDGSLVTILSRSMAVRDDKKRTLRIIGSNTDISDVVAREQEVIELNKGLEGKVLQRTEDLESALKEAEQANMAKTTFLSNMSHEVRTPMNGIIGLTSLCLETDLDDKQRDYLEKVMQSSEMLLKILNEILDFNRIESNMIELEEVELELSELARNIESLMLPAADQQGIAFKVVLDEALPVYVRTDELRLSQVLLNLCGNAVKFTEEGEVTLALSCDAKLDESEGRCGVRFSVSDTGIGIHDTKDLFMPFKQEDASTTRKYGGTGLGLSISKRLVDLLGGELKVESQVGSGSTFEFTLDLPVVKEAKLEVKTVLGKETERLLRKVKAPADVCVLLVEDNKINQMIAEEILKKAGYQVEIADNGEDAVASVEAKDIDLILMDIQMPIMDGEQACQIIREQLRRQDLPIIALTANVLPEQTEQYLNQGFTSFVGKPFDNAVLLETISKYTV
ncbi:hypothetical protein A3755_11745 [Oleiphilus sp. HI0085]|nr:hypothetical protein A3741_05850 [Oleiphilus sp. HI0069]KZZ31482.1 hypothetical protein A3755_11745 [Oleiphilus sp. HI0085]